MLHRSVDPFFVSKKILTFRDIYYAGILKHHAIIDLDTVNSNLKEDF